MGMSWSMIGSYSVRREPQSAPLWNVGDISLNGSAGGLFFLNRRKVVAISAVATLKDEKPFGDVAQQRADLKGATLDGPPKGDIDKRNAGVQRDPLVRSPPLVIWVSDFAHDGVAPENVAAIIRDDLERSGLIHIVDAGSRSKLSESSAESAFPRFGASVRVPLRGPSWHAWRRSQ